MPQFFTTEQLLVNPVGREYRLRIWRPSNPDPTTSINTLLFLDGQWLDSMLDPIIQTVSQTNVQFASLGYCVTERSILAPWRAYDYTPSGPLGHQNDPRNCAWLCGGADALLAFLKKEVLPRLAPPSSVSRATVSLFGHSYAGLFSLYGWLNAAPLFSHIYSASPSLWWYWPYMLDLLMANSNIAQNQTRSQKGSPPLHVYVGTQERWRPHSDTTDSLREPSISTVPFAQTFLTSAQIAGYDKITLQLLEGISHGPMLHSAAHHALEHFTKLNTSTNSI
ncbi:alpha/beta hydrolase [Orrella sp. 11846]|uniref:alpha/beta hydrolase n=1 Tax=Orrella sp. 11846 TaxID=3409913 RepID=UPI003B59B0F8